MTQSTWSLCLISYLIVFVNLNYHLVSGKRNGPTLQIKRDATDPSNPGLWPLPQQMTSTDEYFEIEPSNFQLLTKDVDIANCDILAKAIERYTDLTFIDDCSQLGQPKTNCFGQKSSAKNTRQYKSSQHSNQFVGQLTNLTIEVRSKCETIKTQESDEMYTLRINSDDFPGQAILFANNVWGALYGLEAFSQLLYQSSNGTFRVNSTFILDYPRFPHRGMLIDTSRHYVPVPVILTNLDAMSYNHLNVFHWHIVDDPSFPFESITFPELSEQGAYYPTHVYTPQDVQTVIEYARVRGIRVMSEYDSPGHTQSWGKSQPELLTTCYDTKTGKPDGTFGPIDPSNQANYDFLASLFKEIVSTFPDQYVHLGGDEVDFTCWSTNPAIKQFMAQNNLSDYGKLEEYYMQRVVDIVGGLNSSYMVWQEVFDNGARLKQDTVIHVWKGSTSEWHNELAQVTAAGYRAIVSSPWYLNEISYGADWPPYYAADPQAFNGTAEQKLKVFGGEVCMWGEYVDGSNLISRTWPRALAVAERLWSAADVTSYSKALPRFEVQRCRMQKRGIRVEPVNGAGSCPCDYMLY